MANAEILEIIEGRVKSENIYRIRYNCCQAEASISRRNLLDRIRHDRLTCFRCTPGASNPKISGRKPKAITVFKPGAKAGGVVVLEKIEGNMRTTIVYRARYECCDREVEMGHITLVSRERGGRKLCRYCSAKKQTQGSFAAKAPAVKTAGATDAVGYFWPKLGKLGIRGSY